MQDLIAKGAEWLAGQRAAHMSKEVTYVAGASSTTVGATIGRTVFEVETQPGSGQFQKVESRDFIVATSALAGVPTRGDRILEEAHGSTLTYEVLAPIGQPCWQWADSHRTARRIHTQLTGTEAP